MCSQDLASISCRIFSNPFRSVPATHELSLAAEFPLRLPIARRCLPRLVGTTIRAHRQPRQNDLQILALSALRQRTPRPFLGLGDVWICDLDSAELLATRRGQLQGQFAFISRKSTENVTDAREGPTARRPGRPGRICSAKQIPILITEFETDALAIHRFSGRRVCSREPNH